MHAVELKLLLQSGEYETEMREWLKLLDDQKTWTVWKATFREAYVAKRRAEVAREGYGKLFGGSAVISGSAVNKAHGKLGRRGHTAPAGTEPLKN